MVSPRQAMPSTSDACYEFGPFRLEMAERRLTRNGEALRPPPKVFDLLVALLRRPGHLLTKDELLSEVWGDTFVEEGNLAVNVNRLRRLLEGESGQAYIETIPKSGYRFVGEVRLAAGTVSAGSPMAGAIPGTPMAASIAETIGVLPGHALDGGGQEGSSGPASRPGPRWTPWRLGAAACFTAGAAAALFFAVRPAPSVTTATLRSLVVMPFHAIVPASDQGYLETGMADALAARLSGLEQLRVPPTAAVRSREEPFDAGRRLQVDAVLTGSVQRSGDHLRVTAQLSRVADGGQLWAGRFDEAFTDIFAVQDAIAERIASRLLRDLSGADRAALRRHDTTSTEAYELYLRAREQWSRRTAESVRSAIRMYEQALAIDPQYALAHAGVADAYNLTFSGFPAAIRFARAKAAAEKAIALDPQSAEAHTSLAFELYKFEWRWAESQREFRAAIAINPNYTLAHHWFAELLGILRHDRESIAEFRTALALAPDSTAIRNDLALAQMHFRRPKEALSVIDDALAIDPRSGRLVITRSEILFALGREEESLEEQWRGLLMQGVPESQVAEVRRAYRRGGIRAVRAQAIEQLLQQAARTGTPEQPGADMSSRLAWAYADAGNRERTLFWLNRSADEHADGPLDALVGEQYDFLRQDPAFQALLHRMGLDSPDI